jgi:hypothetical protein
VTPPLRRALRRSHAPTTNALRRHGLGRCPQIWSSSLCGLGGLLPPPWPRASPSPHRSWARRSTSSCERFAVRRAPARRANLARGGCHSGNDAWELAFRGAGLAPSCRFHEWPVVMAVRPRSWRLPSWDRRRSQVSAPGTARRPALSGGRPRSELGRVGRRFARCGEPRPSLRSPDGGRWRRCSVPPRRAQAPLSAVE